MYTIKIEFMAQWISRLASKRNVVGTNLIVGKIIFFILKISPASPFLAVHTPSQYPVYQGVDIFLLT